MTMTPDPPISGSFRLLATEVPGSFFHCSRTRNTYFPRLVV